MPFLRYSKPIITILVILVLFPLSQVSVVGFIIGVPGKASFKNFVKITPSSKDPNERNYTGFCIRVFEEVRRKLDYDLPRYEFVEFNGSYNELVANVANKTYDAAVGDITILADRWNDVEFTVPFTESGLSMVVPVKSNPKAWIFLEPFTLGMWLATAAVLFYTMFIVWFVEHRSNPDFSGPWKDQLGNALWFTFSSLFLAHREKIQSNYARIVVVVWLFLALVLTQSYTASLTSMLTISRLRPTIQSPAKVGCDENSFMKNYVQDVLNYKNATPIRDGEEYLKNFENGSISAAFLEIPYAKVFVNRYCRKFTIIGTTYRFGGFGFIFQKGSGLTANVSKAILKISEDGTLKKLEEEWLTPNKECLDSQTTTENIDSLSLRSFWGLFLFSVATSSMSFLLFLGHLIKNYWRHQSSRVANIDASNESVSIKTVRMARYLMNAEIGRPWRSSPSSDPAAPETIFQKDCRLAADFSKAILQISKDGTLKKLEEEWLTPNKECLDSQTTTENVDSLSLRSFWGLFLLSVATSSISFLLFLGHLIKNYWRHQSSQVANINASDESVSIKMVRVARYLMNAEIGSPWRSSPFSDRPVPQNEIC